MPITVTAATVANGLLQASDDVRFATSYTAGADTVAILTCSTKTVVLWNITRAIKVGYFTAPTGFYGVAVLGNYLYINANPNGIKRIDLSAINFAVENGNLTPGGGYTTVINASASAPHLNGAANTGQIVAGYSSAGKIVLATMANYLLWLASPSAANGGTGKVYSSGGQYTGAHVGWPAVGGKICAADGDLYWTDGQSQTVNWLAAWADTAALYFNSTCATFGRGSDPMNAATAWTQLATGNGSVTWTGAEVALHAKGSVYEIGTAGEATVWHHHRQGGDARSWVITGTGSFSWTINNYFCMSFCHAGGDAVLLDVEWWKEKIRSRWNGGGYTVASGAWTTATFRVTYDGTNYLIEYDVGAGYVTLQTYNVGAVAAAHLRMRARAVSDTSYYLTVTISDLSTGYAAGTVYSDSAPIAAAQALAVVGTGASKTAAIGFATAAWLARFNETTPNGTEPSGTVRGAYANSGGTYNVLAGNDVRALALSSDAAPGSAGTIAAGTTAGVTLVDCATDAALATAGTGNGLPHNTVQCLLVGTSSYQYLGGTAGGAFVLNYTEPVNTEPVSGRNCNLNRGVNDTMNAGVN